MNTLDWIIIAAIAISAVTAYYKGFVYTIFQTLSTIVAIVISYTIYKPVSMILRSTGLYEWLKKITIEMLFKEQGPIGLYEQTKLIQGLKFPIPDIIKEGIVRNNNPEVYSLLKASNFKEYMGGYIANFYLNIIAFIVVCFIVKVILHVVGESLQIIARFPIIRFADKWAGLAVGLIRGIIGVWIGTMIMALLIGLPKFQKVSQLLIDSIVAKWFYENNIILILIDQIFV